MLLNMDAELQHLISVSMEKMTTGANSSVAGRGSRKSGGMDLRKALLVAHFLQEVRCAYFEEDYTIISNTVKGVKSCDCDENENQENQNVTKNFNRCCEESRSYYMETDSNRSSIPSSSKFQSCVTNSDMMVSRISQVTQPLAISVNTSYVLSAKSEDEGERVSGCTEEEVPAFCEELEVSSSMGEDVNFSSTEDSQRDVTSVPRDIVLSSSRLTRGSGTHTEVFAKEKDDSSLSTTKDYDKAKNNADTTMSIIGEAKTLTCPLPKKKRPLPKEFLDCDSKLCPVLKTAKSNCTEPHVDCVTISSQYLKNTFTMSTANTVTLESKTSTSLSTVCSIMGTAPLLNAPNPGKFQTNPKVVVQITQSFDSYLPITCSQLYLEKRLSDMTVRTL